MKITNYIPVILCSIALCGCSDAAKTVGFGTDSDAIEAPATGGTHTVRVSAEKEWVATTDEPWITVSPANGRGTTECRVLIDSALTDQPRRGVIRIMEQNTWVKKEIAVSQKGFDYLIGIDDKEVTVANYAAYGTRHFDVKIKTNVDFYVKVPESAENWLKFEKPAVEFDRRLLELEPVFGRFGNLDVEIHVGLYLDVEVARAVRRVVGDGDLLVVDADEVVEAFLRDGDLLFDPSVLLHDADYAAAGLVGQGRVDEYAAFGRAAAVGGRDGDPRFVGGGDPLFLRRHPDGVGSSRGGGFDGVAVGAESDGLGGVGAAAQCDRAEDNRYVIRYFHCHFSLVVIRAFYRSSGYSGSCRKSGCRRPAASSSRSPRHRT